MTNIVLCGGNGTRLWPVSRTLMPKQFVKLFITDNNKESLFQLTIKRNALVCDRQMIVSNTEQYFLAKDQVENFESLSCQYLLEPIARNTAPAIALACMRLEAEELVLVTPSDHLIKDQENYQKVIQKAKQFASDGFLVTFGIRPTFPETGFGYIEANQYDVKEFHEKPDLIAAQKYLEAGNYYWNSGIFCFKAGVFLEELKKHSPEVYKYSLQAYKNAIHGEMTRVKYEDMLAIPEDSIDYAVMERSSKVKVIPSNIEWSDLGSFDALYDELHKDDNGNAIMAEHIGIGSKNNLIYSSQEKVIATVDLEDIIVVETGDALLIAKKGSSQKVKKVVKKLKERDSELHNIHLTGYRPWGSYTVLEDALGYKIKRIEVKPGKRLSLQKHLHRNEHWIVVSGTATVIVGDETKYIRPNESTYIKMGEIHRLSNEGKIPVVLIEAQVGEYTGEDEIIRIDDDYKREG